MARIEAALDELGTLDRLAGQASPVHRLDPRAKVLATLAFLLATVSFGKYEIAALLPLALYPIALVSLGRIPGALLLRYLAYACPFAILVGMFNPLLDRQVVLHLGAAGISGGWVSFASILLRFVLTVSAALALIATTGFHSICTALARMGAPRILVAQFLLLYRYLFLLGREASRMTRAHSLRAFSGKAMPVGVLGSLAGHLLLRAYDRGQRIHSAMLCRGFSGEMPILRTPQFTYADALFVIGWSAFFVLTRFGHLTHRVGDLLARMIS